MHREGACCLDADAEIRVRLEVGTDDLEGFGPSELGPDPGAEITALASASAQLPVWAQPLYPARNGSWEVHLAE